MIPALTTLVEALSWGPQRIYVDPLIQRATMEMELRFERQGRFFLRRGMPKLKAAKSLRESAGKVREAAPKLPPELTDAAAITAAVETIDLFRDVQTGAWNALTAAALESGAGQTIRDVGAIMSFDMKSEAALQWLRDHGAERLGRDIDQTTKDRVRAVLVQGLKDNKSYTQISKDIKALFEGFRTISPIKYIRSRAELIAVTEIGEAFSEGSWQAGNVLVGRGYDIEKSWLTSPGACAICAPNGSMGWIPFKKDFSSGHRRPLGHPGCRCALVTRTVL